MDGRCLVSWGNIGKGRALFGVADRCIRRYTNEFIVHDWLFRDQVTLIGFCWERNFVRKWAKNVPIYSYKRLKDTLHTY